MQDATSAWAAGSDWGDTPPEVAGKGKPEWQDADKPAGNTDISGAPPLETGMTATEAGKATETRALRSFEGGDREAGTKVSTRFALTFIDHTLHRECKSFLADISRGRQKSCLTLVVALPAPKPRPADLATGVFPVSHSSESARDVTFVQLTGPADFAFC